MGKKAIIIRALYGGKCAGADYWRHVRKAMNEFGFTSCKEDPDIWMRPGTKQSASTYWQFVLLYSDDVLAIMEEPYKFIIVELGNLFTVKEKSIGRPTQYLRNKVSHFTLEDGTKCRSLSSSQYMQNAIKNVEDYTYLRMEISYLLGPDHSGLATTGLRQISPLIYHPQKLLITNH